MRTKTVLVLSPFFRPGLGGLETHLDDLCDLLSRRDLFVQVLTLQPAARAKDRGLSFEKKKNLEIHRFWFFQGLFYKVEPYPILYFLYIVPWYLIVSVWFLLHKAKGIDVIHAQGVNAAIVARVLKLLFKKRVVVSTHATYSANYNLKEKPWLARLIRVALASADKVLTVSGKSRQELMDIGVSSEKIDVYNYWVDQKVFKPLGQERDEARRRLRWEAKFVVLYVGRIVEIKGIRELLAAARITKKGVNYVLIGGGDLANEVENFADKNENTIFLGRIDNKNLPLYYSTADLVIVPSTHEEGFGRIILEALSCGTPVIGANRGAIPEALDESVGKLINITPENIKKAVEYFYDNPKELQKRAKMARKYGEERFGEKNIEVIVKAYEASNSKH